METDQKIPIRKQSKVLNRHQTILLTKVFFFTSLLFLEMFLGSVLVAKYFETGWLKAKDDPIFFQTTLMVLCAVLVVSTLILVLVTRDQKWWFNLPFKNLGNFKFFSLVFWTLCLGGGFCYLFDFVDLYHPKWLLNRIKFIFLINALIFVTMGWFGWTRINKPKTTWTNFLVVSGGAALIFGLIAAVLLSLIWLTSTKTLNFIYLVIGSGLSFSMIALTVKQIKSDQRFSDVVDGNDKGFLWNLLIVLAAMMVNQLVWSFCGLVQWKSKSRFRKNHS